MSRTFTLSAKNSELTADFFPPISLQGPYEIALLAFEAFYSVYNIQNSMVTVGSQSIEVPAGSYELSQLESFIQKLIRSPGTKIQIQPNLIFHKIELSCNEDLELPEKMAKRLGFKRTFFPANLKFMSETVDILPITVINIGVNIAKGIYLNGRQGHTIHTFFPTVPPGYHINETISTPIYYPITQTEIDNITVRIADTNGQLIDFNSEIITVVLHLRPQ